jgi:5-methylcytosine-specific restriction protein B
MTLLSAAIPRQRWSPQSSGVAIAEPGASALRRLWDAGHEVHALRQFVNWKSTQWSADERQWLEQYRITVDLTARLRANLATLDGEALRRIWSERDNGVSDVGAGALPREDFDRSHELLSELTRQILARPDADTFREVLARWEAAVRGGAMAKMYRVVISRVFAAVRPTLFTTILPPASCQRLLAILRDQFQLAQPPSSESDWAALNASITESARQGGLDPERALENNVALWALLKERSRDGAQQPNGPAETAAPLPAMPKASRILEPRNLVLYGPPGTGKTWSTVRQALAIAAPELLEGEPDQEVLKSRFDQMVDSGQVVFTTFHQSFSYEDFVEGLRATSHNGSLQYTVEPGIFKRLCDRAREGRLEGEDPFDKALVSLRARMDEAPNRRVPMKTSRGKDFEASYEGGETFRVFPGDSDVGPGGYTVSMKQVRELYRHGDERGMYNTSYVRGMLQHLRQECQLPAAAVTAEGDEPPKSFVLVIDEINRGNISRIFGEIITLIEVSKRSGMADQLSVTLPYSKEAFSVPANVHIVATMNTADRSLTGMDIALRRRFEFVEMPPQPERLDHVLVGELSIGALLRVMNQRIELLLDRDHCLGHALFLPLENEPSPERLKAIFRHRVFPLLQEYFFDDWQRIQWVLNDHRKPPRLRFVTRSDANLSRVLGDGVPINEQRLWKVNESAFDMADAYPAIIDAKEGAVS